MFRTSCRTPICIRKWSAVSAGFLSLSSLISSRFCSAASLAPLSLKARSTACFRVPRSKGLERKSHAPRRRAIFAASIVS